MVKTEEIAQILRGVEHSYPYHQAVGFLMGRAGFSKNGAKIFKTAGMNFDFYLEQKMEKPHYDPEWRVYYPARKCYEPCKLIVALNGTASSELGPAAISYIPGSSCHDLLCSS